jgi:hypothetical protein
MTGAVVSTVVGVGVGVGVVVGMGVGNLRAEMKSDFAKIHESISSQTKWLLAMGIGMITIYPILNRVISKLIPL